MILETLSLANYRGFEQLDLRFDPRVTVIAGVNGVGKSGILHALRVLFSHVLPETTPARKPPIVPSFTKDDITIKKLTLTASVNFRIDDVELQAVGTHQVVDQDGMKKLDVRLKEVRANLRHAGKNPRRIRELKREEKGLLASQTGEQGDYQWIVIKAPGHRPGVTRAAVSKALKAAPAAPVVVLFTTNRQTYERPRTLASLAPFAPYSAYIQALQERSMRLGEFMDWFNSMQKLPGANIKIRQQVIARLQAVVTTFIPEFSDLRIQESPRLRFVVTKSGVPLSFDQLSDGERGMLAILFDITRRLAIANPQSNDPVAEGSAIVLIDEIELHLHPLWQRQVLKRLAETFKRCQFVVTSHSPQVLGEVEGEQLRLIQQNRKLQIPAQAFGMDSNWILTVLMGAEEQDPDVKVDLNEVAALIASQRLDEAEAKIIAIRHHIGNSEALQRAASTIERIRMLKR